MTAARRGETRSGSLRSTAERPRRGDVRGKVLLIDIAPDMRRYFIPQLSRHYLSAPVIGSRLKSAIIALWHLVTI